MNDEFYDDKDREQFGKCEECLQPILSTEFGDYCCWYCWVINTEEEN